MGRPAKRAAHKSHPYCKPLRSSIDHHIRLRQLLGHNDLAVELTTARKGVPEWRRELGIVCGTTSHYVVGGCLRRLVSFMKFADRRRLNVSEDPVRRENLEGRIVSSDGRLMS
ncbi:hypothetical protein EVAR_84021_1 [Eumeta japonica]|uniref:Uncharacterized protein n=1 Tax=Eumeta variegata TaxID=151549 RepID=A0A4C1X510_EUMVA|nr:hypothetical protein EVAR_84021_1 [Eumeta japonica]